MSRRLALLLWFLCAGSTSAADDPSRPPIREPELRTELLTRYKADQDFRREVAQWMAKRSIKDFSNEAAIEAALDAPQRADLHRLRDKGRRIDAENTERLSQIVAAHGWPTRSLVGREGAFAAWLLIQHADQDPKFQRRCLDLMSRAPRDEIDLANLAYLTDRVQLAEGKKQVYGTQYTLVDGKCQARPLEDEANVDARRKEMGLAPLADYLRESEEFTAASKR